MQLFVDNLSNIDFSYLCPQRGLVGETWLAHIQLDGELDEQGMICDFGKVKKHLRNWLDEMLDHRLLIPERNHWVQIQEHGNNKAVTFSGEQDKNSAWVKGPSEAFSFIQSETIDPESVAQHCIDQKAPVTITATVLKSTSATAKE